MAIGRLTRRAEFVRTQAGRSFEGRSFVLKARKRTGGDDTPDLARFGYTVTKRLGTAVLRNRARRRLKEAVRLAAKNGARGGFDYVLIGRPGALRSPFGQLLEELGTALRNVHDAPPGRRRRR